MYGGEGFFYSYNLYECCVLDLFHNLIITAKRLTDKKFDYLPIYLY